MRMVNMRRGMTLLAVAIGMLTMAACASYPTEPRYSTRPVPVNPTGVRVVTATEIPPPPRQSAPPPGVEFGTAAPVGEVEGGALEASGINAAPEAAPMEALPVSRVAGARYTVQPGDTLSGIGRRFLTPIQVLIEMNDLGPRAALSVGGEVILPDSAVDSGQDPYATGPSPTGVRVPSGALPPPPPPPSGNAPMPPVANGSTARSGPLDWPVRGDILRRFGPVGMGERNNGINIGAPLGSPVRASAAGRVGYVGDTLPGQGLTVLVLHRDGWRTVYGHLGSATVREGDDIAAGAQLGTVGDTAGDGQPSIHFEVWRMQGDQPTALDPLLHLPR
jgi:murein DD-endopeptidase MepM/ murein hydrolase activator NlpD